MAWLSCKLPLERWYLSAGCTSDEVEKWKVGCPHPLQISWHRGMRFQGCDELTSNQHHAFEARSSRRKVVNAK